MYWNYNKHSRKERRMLLVAECVKENPRRNCRGIGGM